MILFTSGKGDEAEECTVPHDGSSQNLAKLGRDALREWRPSECGISLMFGIESSMQLEGNTVQRSYSTPSLRDYSHTDASNVLALIR